MASVIGRKDRKTVAETYIPLIPIKHSDSSFIPGGDMKYPNSIPDGKGREVPLSVERAYDFDYTIRQQGRPFGPQVRVYGKIEHDDGCVHIVHIIYPADVNGWVPQFVGFFRTRIGLAEAVTGEQVHKAA